MRIAIILAVGLAVAVAVNVAVIASIPQEAAAGASVLHLRGGMSACLTCTDERRERP
jgi:hypothetical protein